MSLKYALFKPREVEKSFLLSVVFMTVRMLFFVVLLIGVSATGLIAGIGKAWIDTTPTLDLDKIGAQAQTSFIYDKTGNLIMEFKGTQNRIYVEIDEIPANLINAVISVEDVRFFEHHGVDLKRIIGAMINNVMGGNTQGASTLTCQLVKLTMLSSDQNYRRKAQEAYLAVEVEKNLTKEEILEAYLNIIYLGGSSYGVKIAAQDYFGKNLDELTLRECASLAAMIRNPTRYNPRRCYYGTGGNPSTIEDRTDYVLELMLEQQMITQEEYDEAISQRLSVVETSTATAASMYDNAYYVEYAIHDVVTKMLRVEGLEDNHTNRSAMETKLRNGGYKVFTSLDANVQKAVQDVITNWSHYPEMRYSNDSSKQSSLGGGEFITVIQPQASAAVMNWHTGELLAVVGGRAEPVQRLQLNRAYQMNMPVGSSIKPLSVYGPALDLGRSPGSPVWNLPIPIEGWVGGAGYPKNYSSSGDYTGVESLRYAINKSHNTSTAHVLYEYVGIENSVQYLLKLGIDPDRILANGSGLALGSSGPSVIEMAAAFGAIANSGTYLEPYAFTQILNPDGTVYIDVQEVQLNREVFKPSTAWMLVDMLKGCVASYGTGSKANFGNITVAGKTGTNSNNVGVTFAGMTGYYSGAVWIGSDDYKPLASNSTGGNTAAPLWAEIMARVHGMTGCTSDRAIMGGNASDYGLIQVEACQISGMLPTSACRHDYSGRTTYTDLYLSGTQPTEYCNMHRAVTLCSRSNRVATSNCRSTYVAGLIYIPEGHPLRYAKNIEDVTAYFPGASIDENSTTLPYCSSC
ncbi:MAG: transglycosylase domain-containing protein [Christensenellales bacterium]|nr:transglycosylase domain-containing protein [Christensenellales bacterium]